MTFLRNSVGYNSVVTRKEGAINSFARMLKRPRVNRCENAQNTKHQFTRYKNSRL